MATAQDLRDHLDWLNEHGMDDRAAGVAVNGEPFLAVLRGPYAEFAGAQVVDPYDRERDVPGEKVECEDCRAHGPVPLDQLKYPVTVLVP